MHLNDEQVAYLRGQHLGRLATIDPSGQPQNNPVGFEVDDEGRIIIYGRDLAATKKFRNIASNPKVAFVVDDIASYDPWRVRCVEIRGLAEARVDDETSTGFETRHQIRITPLRVISFGLE